MPRQSSKATYSGWTKFCSTFKPWETIVCWCKQGTHQFKVFLDAIFCPYTGSNRLLGPPHPPPRLKKKQREKHPNNGALSRKDSPSKPPGIRPRVLVLVSIHLGSILGFPNFDPHPRGPRASRVFSSRGRAVPTRGAWSTGPTPT